MADVGQAKGRLAHALFAEKMLEKGVVVPFGDAAQLLEAGESMMSKLEAENAELLAEKQALLARLEMAENAASRIAESPRERLQNAARECHQSLNGSEEGEGV